MQQQLCRVALSVVVAACPCLAGKSGVAVSGLVTMLTILLHFHYFTALGTPPAEATWSELQAASHLHGQAGRHMAGVVDAC